MTSPMEKKVAHLEMIQGVVNRLSNNSFLLKGWSVILVSAFFALATGGTQIYFVYLAYFPAVAFWVLDGYFLRQERLFRKLYDHVRRLDEEAIDFSMDTSTMRKRMDSWFKVTFSLTLMIFHGTVIGAIILVTIIGHFIN